MDAEKLIADNPLTKEQLKEWFLNKLMESVENFDRDDAFKEFMIKSGITAVSYTHLTLPTKA